MQFNQMNSLLIHTFKSLGVIFENTKYDAETNLLTLHVSVPENSRIMNAENKSMTNILLAKRLKIAVEDLGFNSKVYYKLRNETWTEEDYELCVTNLENDSSN